MAKSLLPRRLIDDESSFWGPFQRDVERIIQSKAFRRYSDKTQVVYLVENDHLIYRGLHVMLVSSFARTLAVQLGLNVGLVEAISLGHDVGHAPFGHEGEGYLSEISKEKGLGAFSHAHQSCRLFRYIEPLNLSFYTYDGFLSHDGGLDDRVITVKKDKSWNDHYAECEERKKNPEKNLAPASLEGALVKIADTVSYLGRDIEEALSLGILDEKDVPKSILGKNNKEILENVGRDIVNESKGREYIAISKRVFSALQELRDFNFRNIYVHPALKVESKKIKAGYRLLFDFLAHEYKEKKEESHLTTCFLHSREDSYRENTSLEQQIIDYIAGMTDSYFVSLLSRSLIPQKITL
jgi:dGTPase